MKKEELSNMSDDDLDPFALAIAMAITALVTGVILSFAIIISVLLKIKTL